MKNNLLYLFSLLLNFLLISPASGSTYEEDRSFLQMALKQSALGVKELKAFEDPFSGKNNFMIPNHKAPWAGNYFPMKKRRNRSTVAREVNSIDSKSFLW